MPAGSAEALHLWLPQSRSLKPPTGSREPSQHRSDLAAAAPKARLQDDCRLPARQPQSVPCGVPPVRAAMPADGPVWPRTAGSGWHPDQGGQQQGSHFTRASLSKFIELADAKLDDYLQRLDQSDASERKTGGSRVKNLAEKIAAIRQRRTRCKDMLAQLDQTGEDQISLTDPDSRAMAAHTHVAVGYNAQIAVDAKHKLIVEQQVTNQVLDLGLLTQTAEPAKEILGVETIEVVADRGYFKAEDIEACEKAGMAPYV